MSVEIVEPKVVLLKSPVEDEERWSAKAARFCTSPDTIETIMDNNTNDEKVLKNVLDYGHLSVTEFDNWIFGIENVSRTLTHQLVRKRIASYAQESMRYTSQGGTYKIIEPESLKGKTATITVPRHLLNDDSLLSVDVDIENLSFDLSLEDLAAISHDWYTKMQEQSVPNEDARFGLLEASKTKIMVGMNSHALLDFFCERTCTCAQWEIRGVAQEMLRLAKEADPLGMKNAGPKCNRSSYCYESKTKWEKCKRVANIHDVRNMVIEQNGYKTVYPLGNNEVPKCT